MRELVDIGCNLTHDSFDADRGDVLARAASAGVTRLIVTGTSVTSSVQAAALCETSPASLFSTAGVHPHNASQLDAHSVEALRAVLEHPRCVAIGECGLDFFRDFSPRDAQRHAFAAQLELASAAAKPVFLHQRDAHEDFVAMLAPVCSQLVGGVAHCFTGGRRELEAYLELGLHIGITGWVCDERRGRELREAVPHIPLERLLVETDAPYLLPRDLVAAAKGRRNEPAFLPQIVERVAALMNLAPDAIAEATTSNAERLFGLKRAR